MFLSSLARAAVPPETIALLRAIEQPAPPPPGMALKASETITFKVPDTETSLIFKRIGPNTLYQTDLSLCLLEGMNDLFALAIKNKGDGPITGNKFEKSYGQAGLLIQSYSPPAFRMTTAVSVDTLRAIGLFSSIYGYYEVTFDVQHRKLGHVGVGLVKFLRQ